MMLYSNCADTTTITTSNNYDNGSRNDNDGTIIKITTIIKIATGHFAEKEWISGITL